MGSAGAQGVSPDQVSDADQARRGQTRRDQPEGLAQGDNPRPGDHGSVEVPCAACRGGTARPGGPSGRRPLRSMA